MSALGRSQPVLSAIVAKLGADAALTMLVGSRIYDAPPGRAATPEITLRTVAVADRSSADTDAEALTVDCDVWDRYALGGDLSRPRLIMGHIRRILHMQPLSVPGCAVVLMRCTATQGPFRDPDTVALHGVVTLAVLAGHETAPAF